MRDPFTFVLVLIAMVFAFQIIKHKMGIRTDRRGNSLPAVEDSAETRMLRDEVKVLKERLAVLERITVEKENSLAREIEDLRHK